MKSLKDLKRFFKRESGISKGMSLLEVVIYVAILGGISVFVIDVLAQSGKTYQRARAEREVISNARLLVETLSRNIDEAREIYTPTSRFFNDAGQLSLLTTTGADFGHDAVFVDFWADGGKVWMRREGGQEVPLTSASVRVVKFRVERIVQGLNRESLKFIFQIDSAGKYPASITINNTDSLRGNY